MNRREFITTAGAITAYMMYSTKGFAMFGLNKNKEASSNFPYTLSEKEWREKLTEQEYKVLRDHGTERAFSSPLDTEKRQGIFACALNACARLKAEFMKDRKLFYVPNSYPVVPTTNAKPPTRRRRGN